MRKITFLFFVFTFFINQAQILQLVRLNLQGQILQYVLMLMAQMIR